MTFDVIDAYIKKLDSTSVKQPYEKGIVVYYLKDKMFALLDTNKHPLQLSIKCDTRLSQLLKDKYTEVMPGHKLNKKEWITIIISGELSQDEIIDLIRHSYELVSESVV
jgi:predicted DNA-binding protein (MmcQ/YjbR family)